MTKVAPQQLPPTLQIEETLGQVRMRYYTLHRWEDL